MVWWWLIVQRLSEQRRFRPVEVSDVQWWNWGDRWLSADQTPHWVVSTINQFNLFHTHTQTPYSALSVLLNLSNWMPSFAFWSVRLSTSVHSNIYRQCRQEAQRAISHKRKALDGSVLFNFYLFMNSYRHGTGHSLVQSCINMVLFIALKK